MPTSTALGCAQCPPTRMLSAPTMTAQRQERNGSSVRNRLSPRNSLDRLRRPCLDKPRHAALAASAAQAATTERVVVNRFTGLAIEGFDPVAYFVDARPEIGLRGLRGLAGRRGLAFPQRGQSRLLCRPSRHLRPPVRRLRPDRSGPRRHRRRQSPVLADLGTAALSVRPRAEPGRLRRRSRLVPAAKRTSAGRRWSRSWRSKETVISGWSEGPDLRCAIADRGISRFRVRIFDAPRNDGLKTRPPRGRPRR